MGRLNATRATERKGRFTTTGHYLRAICIYLDSSEVLHGDRSQSQREGALVNFKVPSSRRWRRPPTLLIPCPILTI
eukprot:1191993-Prorocentrum_minimum.AAC.1